jgi:hypothetical protein
MSIADMVRKRDKSLHSVIFTFDIGLKPLLKDDDDALCFAKDDAQLLFNDHHSVVPWSEAKFLVPVWWIWSTMT